MKSATKSVSDQAHAPTAARPKAATFVNHGPEAVAQREMAHAVNNSPQMTAQREVANAVQNSPQMAGLRAFQGRPPHGRHGNVIQGKLIKWENPEIKKDVAEGFDIAQNLAKTLDTAAQKGKDTLQDAVNKLNAKTITTGEDFKKQFDTIGGASNKHVNNFTNHLNDYLDPDSDNKPPYMDAGYVIEDYVTKETPTDGKSIKSQYHVKGARPDFKLVTGKTHEFVQTGQPVGPYTADGFVDITSQEEAKDGHILKKVVNAAKINPEVAINHPHLWDSYYEPIDWGSGAKVVPMETDDQMEARAKRKADELEEFEGHRKRNKDSLRRRDKSPT